MGSSSLVRDWTCAPVPGAWSPSHWTSREVPGGGTLVSLNQLQLGKETCKDGVGLQWWVDGCIELCPQRAGYREPWGINRRGRQWNRQTSLSSFLWLSFLFWRLEWEIKSVLALLQRDSTWHLTRSWCLQVTSGQFSFFKFFCEGL